MQQRGLFITFEGVEGSGKSTQIKRAASFLEARAKQFLITKEPGGTHLGGQIRAILLNARHTEMTPACEALLYLADRAQHVQQVVLPALKAGTWVLSDRYHDSTIAYQGVARGIGAGQLQPIFELATGGLTPDRTFLLDLPVAVGLARARRRNQELELAISEGRFEAEKLAFHQKIRHHFQTMAQAEPRRFVSIDAEKAAEEVAVTIQTNLQQLLDESAC